MATGLADLLAGARNQLVDRSDTPSLDAQLLMMRALAVPRSWLLAHPEYNPDSEEQQQFDQYLARYLQGEALPHVLGWWEFFGRQFHLDKHVLVPRPETEKLVEVALGRLAERPDLKRVVDIGTGSGCIAISLALEFSDREYFATDLDRNCLRVAGRNLRQYALQEQVGLVQADLLAGVHGPFDLITANLPYLPSARLAELAVARQEPSLALDGGADGLEPLRSLTRQLRPSLRPGGEAVFELDPDQMQPAQAMLSEAFTVEHVKTYKDLAGRARVLYVRRDPDG